MSNVKIDGLTQLRQKFKQLSKEVATKKERQSILAVGARPIVADSKKIVPKSNQPHFYYYKGKKIEIKPGNLKKSIRFYKQRDGDVSIGPKRLRKISGTIGDSPKTASGYYASALYQKAAQYRQQVTEKALQAKLQQSLDLMDKQVSKILKKYG
jgi:hypothetical protein